MASATARLTVNVPRESLLGAKLYASRHGMTLTGLVTRYFERISPHGERLTLPPEVASVAGIIPGAVNVVEEYVADMERKH